ncbi:hypothetical protein BJF78_29180 [Pseudonocardia sp. CNS-139]|nr:hypothetical protein BJF78_29180 [Pseudonocardia sp. CNS-139]
MTASTTTPIRAAGAPQSGRVLALTAAELRLLLRNRTVAVSALVVPLMFGLLFALISPDGDALVDGSVAARQLVIVLGMSVYVTATQTVVSRRHARVLKRFRTSALSDTGLLVAVLAPAVVIGLGQLVVIAVIDVLSGFSAPVAPLALLAAVAGGLLLCVPAALATSAVTPSPERAQITTLPLTFVLLAAGVVVPLLPPDGPLQLLLAVPGSAIGALATTAFTGQMWGSPLFSVAALLVWPAVFAWLAARRFRWDARN